jgi:hypothetical protein
LRQTLIGEWQTISAECKLKCKSTLSVMSAENKVLDAHAANAAPSDDENGRDAV